VNPIYRGTCLCETVRYQIEGDLGPVYNCHCSKCRRWHGALFRTRASVARHQFTWLEGEDLLSHYYSSAIARKSFCSRCGSALITTYDDRPDVIGLPLAALEPAPDVTPVAHIFVESKCASYHIADNLPQYAQWPGSESAVRETAYDTETEN
jgi:hypothetical protein